MVVRTGYWWHSIDLGRGITTKGMKSAAYLTGELQALRLPDLRAKSVLDIGAFDGYYSFASERLGAKRVVALEHDAWFTEIAITPEYEKECREQGITPEPYPDPRKFSWHFREDMPGKRRFETARRALGSKVESVLADFLKINLHELGTFDVVLFLGVLYHLE